MGGGGGIPGRLSFRGPILVRTLPTPATPIPAASIMSLETLRAGHHDSVLDYARTAAALPEAAWQAALAPGKWSPEDITQHLWLTYSTALNELEPDPRAPGRRIRPRVPRLLQPVFRLTVMRRILRNGRFPEGAKAPSELRPKAGAPGARTLTPSMRGEALSALTACAGRVEELLASRPGARLSHHIFGRIGREDALRLLAAHNRHHQRQLSSPA